MEFRVLGPVEVWEGECLLHLGPRMHRAVLAVLLVHANRVVSADHLADQLWGSQPPATAHATLLGYVAGLRRVLEPDRPARTPPRVLLTRPPGYLLRVPPDSYDATRFESGVAEGMALLAADQPEAARSALTRALALWRGAALEEFAFEDFARPEAARLEELRLAAQEASLQAELELGLHATAVAELERLTAAQPLRERLWALLMLALYRSGRQADALRAYAHARRLLAGELGLEPGAELRQLEDRILAHDPSLDWRPQAPVSIATPVAPSQPAGPPSSPAAATAEADTAVSRRSPAGTPLVGREAELATLHHALDGLDEAGGSALVIIGEPGIGKTTLLVELAGRAEERGHLVCRGRADEFERDVPFAIFIDALDAALASRRGGDGALSDERAAELGAVFPSLATSVMQVPALPQERYRLHRAVGRALEQLAARRPVVLVLDDLHWADAASVELTSHLLRHPPQARVLLCLAARPGQATSRLVSAFAVAARAGLAERIDLGPLSPADVQKLLGSGIDEATREELWRESGGNPFYLKQLLRVRGRGRGRDAGDGQTVPAVVAVSIADEVSVLSETARTAARAAAVLGDGFDPEVVASTGSLPLEETLAALDELDRVGLITSTDVPRSFRFRHPIVRRAIYESAGAGWRLGAHARAARALAARGAPVAARAHHVEQAAGQGDEEAFELLTQAGHSASPSAPATAARWFEAALRLVPAADIARRLEILVPMATSLGAAGQLQESRDALIDTLELLPREHIAVRARLVAFCAAVEHLLGRHRDARTRLRQALDELGDASSPEAVALMIELAAAANYTTDFSEQEAWSERAAAAARGLGIRPLTAATAAMLAYARFCVGRTPEARRAQQEASHLLDSLTDAELAQRLDSPFYLGFAECFLERYDDSLRHFDRGIAVARASGQGQFVIPTMAGQTFVLTMLGRLDEAQEQIEATIEAARLSGVTELLFWGSFIRSWVAAMAGDVDTALATGEETLKLAAVREANVIIAASGWTVGSGLLEAGRADRCIEVILTMTGGTELPKLAPAHRCMSMEMLTRAELARGRFAEARRWAERASDLAAALGLAVPAAQAGRARAAVLLASGEAATAAEIALEAVRCAEQPGARLEAARSRLLAGRALGASGQSDRAIAELRRADAELGACGARRYREEAADELRRLWHGIAAPRQRAGRSLRTDSPKAPST